MPYLPSHNRKNRAGGAAHSIVGALTLSMNQATLERPPRMSGFDVDFIAAALAPTLHGADQERSASEYPVPLAGVALVLRPALPGSEVLLIRRAEVPDDPWSGHMALPGGRMSARDRHSLDAARRETFEEVGLELGAGARLLGRLPSVRAIAQGKATNLSIEPFVFAIAQSSEIVLDPSEVAEALWISLGSLSGESLRTRFRYARDGAEIDLPAWNVDGRIVWGLTHRTLENLFAALSRFAEENPG
jgi:8-oxo-dGTP pyrophosphatase MutT (NUDIX family)